jgi:hypothetical protein
MADILFGESIATASLEFENLEQILEQIPVTTATITQRQQNESDSRD